jgi:hypothetical protein
MIELGFGKRARCALEPEVVTLQPKLVAFH